MNEQKWFVYVEDHHDGPYSVAEIQQKINQGVIQKEQYVWAEGMQDWMPMAEVPDFSPLFSGGTGTPASLLSSEVSIGLVDQEGLPAMDVPIQTMMDQATLDQAASLSMATSPSIPTRVSAPAPTPAPANLFIPAPAPEPVYTPAPAQMAAPFPPEESSYVPTPHRVENTQRRQASSRGDSYTKENLKLVQEGVAVRGGPNKFKRLVKWVFFLVAIGGGGYGYMRGYLDPVLKNPQFKTAVSGAESTAGNLAQPLIAIIVEKVPFLGQFLSPIPKLPDVPPAEYEELRAAASASISSVGPQAAIASTPPGAAAPSFYIASNLPDGTNLVVDVQGVGDTLLNALEFKKKVQVTLQGKLAKASPFSQTDNQPLPKGEYNIYVYEAEQQPDPVKAVFDSAPSHASAQLPRVLAQGKKLGAAKKYFLGGAKDSAYQERLKEYHDRVRARAQQDHDELSQVIQTLVKQYNDSYSLFTSLRTKNEEKYHGRTIGLRAQKTWTDESSRWRRFQTQIGKFEKWTPEYLQGAFYGQIYDSVKKASTALVGMEDVQDEYFQKKADPKTYDNQLNEAQTQAKQLLSELLVKIKKVETTLGQTQGLPPPLD